MIFTFSFSACSEKEEFEEATIFPIEQIGKARTSGNGAVYKDYMSSIHNKRFTFEAVVQEVESQVSIICNTEYSGIYKNFYGLNVHTIDLTTTADQTELLKTLKKGDKLEFDGTFQTSFNDSIDSFTIDFYFIDVIIKTVNGNAI